MKEAVSSNVMPERLSERPAKRVELARPPAAVVIWVAVPSW
jgi:hypothetical protein